MSGQYFTTDTTLQKVIIGFIENNPKVVLEPAFGKGHLIQPLLETYPNVLVDAIEIDPELKPVIEHSHIRINFSNFFEVKFNVKYMTIIGNPPFVKGKKNLYLQFIEKCIELLDDEGELIFIVPSDFFKLTSAKKLISQMTDDGSFTHLYFPNREDLFDGARIDVAVFRYQKDVYVDRIEYNGELKYTNFREGIITFSEREEEGTPLSDLFEVYVGMVSGCEKVFKHAKLGCLSVLNDENRVDRYIYTTFFPTGNEEIDKHLETHKERLLSRRIRKFTEDNWFEWGALRNKKKVEEFKGKECIYIRTLTRKHKVAFRGKVMYFGGGLICLIPKGNIDLEKILNFLNSSSLREKYTYCGRFKIGQRQVKNILFS